MIMSTPSPRVYTCVLLRSAIVLLCILEMRATAVPKPGRSALNETQQYLP